MMRCLALVALLCASTGAVVFKDCGSVSGSYDKIEVSNCDLNAPACVLKKGTDVSFGLHFTPSKASTKVTAVVHGIIDDLDVPFPIPNAESCLDPNSGVKCPLTADVGTSYHATFPILHQYPTVSLSVRWELRDENGDNIVCVEIPVSIR